jgi:hypothetical protein
VFLWQKGVMTDLNVLVSADSPLHLFDPGDINSRGEIAGLAIEKNTGAFLPFLAIPCDSEHAGIEGCDYAPMDAGVAFQNSAESAQARAASARASLTPSAIKARVRSLAAGRNRRFVLEPPK